MTLDDLIAMLADIKARDRLTGAEPVLVPTEGADGEWGPLYGWSVCIGNAQRLHAATYRLATYGDATSRPEQFPCRVVFLRTVDC